MNSYLDKIRPENYQRAFFFKRLGYLLTDVCTSHYRKRDWLAIYNNEMLGSYIRNEAVAITLKNGKEIFASDKNFKIFETGFRKTITETGEYIENAKKLESVQVSDFYDLRAMVDKMYYFFEKTEFFFTDACYESEMSYLLKKNLLILGDDLKMKSRPLFVEIITTCLYHLVDLAAQQTGTNAEDLKFYDVSEIIRLLETSKFVEPKVIQERKKSFVIYCEHGRIIPIEGDEKTIVLERFKEPDHSSVSEFKGIVANKGNITARARVILPELNLPYETFVKKLYSMEMNEGEILITETTSPDFVPLMKKAGGIIANQGGLNSHAAIMSRELGVPCLVGTYHATDIVKTGDLIELNADKGMVRILKRAE